MRRVYKGLKGSDVSVAEATKNPSYRLERTLDVMLKKILITNTNIMIKKFMEK